MPNRHNDARREIPWNDMIGMRNRRIHECFLINLETVWDAIQNDIPRLAALVEPLVRLEEERAEPDSTNLKGGTRYE